MYAKLDKCAFWMEKIAFLGHIISKDGLVVDSSKVKAIMNWQSPKNLAKARSFLGLAGYYKIFVKGFSKISTPLTKLTRNNVPFVRSQERENNF